MAQFRAKARAVELLGKGQISDLPTAISELWKNGYDAYGDKLEAFLYLEGYENITQPFFVMADDGKGMTRADILEKWIVLGTDSKSRNIPDVRGEETLWKEPRIKMGEKGIGRLSVAYLGSPMLMITKKIGSPTQAVFFDWRILENYNLFLEEINIPIRDISTAKDFPEIFEELRTEFLSNFRTYKRKEDDPWSEQLGLKEQIISACTSTQLPDFFEQEILSSLVGDSKDIHGTKFIISNPDPQILLLKNPNAEDSEKETIYHLRSSLLGLFNTFLAVKKEYKTHFWIVQNSGKRDFIAKNDFFNPEDFKICDHVIDGNFDESGKFNGKLRIFEKTVTHKFQPHRVIYNNKTSYGPFSMKIGYVQGDRGFETPMLKGVERDVFLNKLNDFGGLYIYRDGFRVLPYGRTSNDFLEFEKRRTERVSTYFFSYRRMFGFIDITRKDNSKLIDKAGREGFISNAAYRDFINDLKEFFIDLAKTYFADTAKDTTRTDFQEKYEELIANEKLEKEREKKDRREFASLLTSLPKHLSEIESKYASQIVDLERLLGSKEIQYEELSEILNKIEDTAITIDSYRIKEPTRFQLTDLQKKKFQDYTNRYKKLVNLIQKNSSDLLSKAHDKLKDQELLKEFHNRGSQYRNSLENSFSEFDSSIMFNIERLKTETASEKETFINEFDSKYQELTPIKVTRSEINHSIKLLAKVFNDIKVRAEDRMRPFLNHLSKITPEINEDDLMGYYKIKYEEIREELEQIRELSQLGIAVEIIDHEFNVLYSELAETIGSVKGDISANKFKMLSLAFEHLENNYKLLQPLYRSSGRIRKEVSAQELYNYGVQFFQNKFTESDIEFVISKEATKYTIYTYESIIKAVLINVVNNAIYWVRKSTEKIIEIHSMSQMLIIRNSGEPIEDFMLEDIFKMFYSKRPQGRGIGLYLAKQSLNKIGLNIYATNNPKLNTHNGACFIITTADSKPL